MRKIIINRLKSVVGCAGKINIYSIDKIANTVGHYEAYFKGKRRTFQGYITA